MAFYSTTINSATPAVDLMTWVDTNVLANSWTAVETWTSSTKVANVYKSPAGSNTVGVDFFLVVYRSATTTTTVSFRLCEAYDLANHKLQKYVPNSGAGITVNATDNTVTDATGVLPDSSTGFGVAIETPLSTSRTYLLDVDVNRMILGVSLTASTSNTFVYAGVADSMLTTAADPVCLVLMNQYCGNVAVAGGGSTREPGTPAPATGNFRLVGNGDGPSFYYAFAPYSNTISATTATIYAGDLYRPNPSASIYLNSGRDGNSPRCTLQNIVTCRSGGAIGDTLSTAQKNGSTRTYTMISKAATAVMQMFIRTS
jgi:hypothetical protein